MRPRRSCLSVPGSSPEMIAKARGVAADEIVVDLEDSVAERVKDEARATVARALREAPWEGRTVSVRLNGTDTRHCYRDVADVLHGAEESLDGFVIPKAQGAADIDFVARLAGMVEAELDRREPVRLQALIETASGLANVREIAHASERLDALIVGYADLGASLGVPAGAAYPGDRWHYALETVLVAARDAGLQAVDGPYLDIADAEGFRASAERSRALGFDGKWAVHPSQLEPLNELFSPTQLEFEQASAVVAALERSETHAGRGATLLDGAMIDEASRKHALRTVASGRAAGLRSPAGP